MLYNNDIVYNFNNSFIFNTQLYSKTPKYVIKPIIEGPSYI